jgi:hypothetical protein
MSQSTLPEGLLVYAENIFRRFPEEFIALGCPQLEKDFDLRAATRRFAETSGTKSIEITLHRHRVAEGPPVSPQLQTGQVGDRRMEDLVSALTERCAALEKQQPMSPQEPRSARQAGAPLSLQRPPPLQTKVDTAPVVAHAVQPSQATQSRGVTQSQRPASAGQPAARQTKSGEDSPKSPFQKNRPSQVQAPRIAKDEHEPESPRSPGWFSAWGSKRKDRSEARQPAA